MMQLKLPFLVGFGVLHHRSGFMAMKELRVLVGLLLFGEEPSARSNDLTLT